MAKHSTDYRISNNSFFSIFKYADKYDVLLMILGFIGSVGEGASIPSMMLIMSSLVNVFGNAASSYNSNSFVSEINRLSLDFVYVGLAVGVACFFEAFCWIKTAERQASRLRSLYLKAILRQDETFFDTQGSNTAEVIESVAADSHIIQEVISEKVPHFVTNVSTFVTSYIVGFILAWQLAAVSLAFLPLLLIPGVLYGRILAGLAVKMKTEYLKAGAVAEQALSSVRTVYSFVGEEKTLSKYSAFLDSTVKLGLKQGIAKGLAIGSNGVVFAIWAFNAWYGNKLVIEHGVSGGRIVATGLTGIIGGLALGTSLPNIKYFSDAAVAGGRILEMINHVPEIDHYDESGRILDHVDGELELRSVRFAYPARPESVIFDGFSLLIPAGKTTALVGSSGSGKSTVVSLLQRFYDPQEGEVLMDGVNLRNLKLRWLRAEMGLVSQEPAMFATTVKQNILIGAEDATTEEIIEAAKKSNAHNFISQLPYGYDTQVGERGVQLSGGQKQRIAIARALIRNPKVLLLDEATSALDTESERVVQEALDMAAVGRTTVVVAHRLSTVRHADAIAVVQSGRVSEIGNHNKLMEKPGSAYAALVMTSTAEKPVSENAGDVRYEKRTSSLAQRTSSAALSRDSESFKSVPEGAPVNDGTPSIPSLRRLVALNLPEWRNGVFGTLGASVFGVIQPLYAFCLGGTVIAFFLSDREQQSRLIRNYSFGFLAIAVVSFLTNAVQHYNFAAMGEHLTKRVRQRMLANILTFEIGWFDASESNSSGAIAGRLAADANSVRSLVGDRWSLLVTTAVSIAAASAFGLALAWQLALVILAGQPFIILCFYFRRVMIKKMSEKALTMQQQSNQLAAESVANHRTVAAFCSQPSILRIFEASQDEPHRASSRQAVIGGVGLGSAQITMFSAWALDFWFAGKLISWGDITSEAMFKTFFILVSTGRVIADAGSMTSDIAKGAAAVAAVFGILDRRTLIFPDDGEKVDRIKGDVELRHVDFSYPQRPDVLVFRDFNLRIPAGKSVALVGKSGSGKSTVIALIERFYDPVKGRVLIDGKDIRKMHLRSLRRYMSLVGQEPTLFAGTVRENILYGKDDASEDEIVEAAKAANAHDFICALSNGYDTNVGERGVQISGGQKQRIAIARAILKNPAILLLDEATSALDTQSEKVVQEALDRIMVNRTTIVVAHRLSTIQNCDSISVVQDGAIVEHGKHVDLMGRGESSVYFNLVKLQHQHLTTTY